MENIKELLGGRIKEIRKQQKLTQEKLAELVGIEPNNLSRIENGKNFPSPDNLVKISTSLGMEVYELFLYEHLKDAQDLKTVLLNAIEHDEELTSTLFKFYQAVK